MGRGGEKVVTPTPQKPLAVEGQALAAPSKLTATEAAATISSNRPSKTLETISTEVLRKKAQQFGHDATANREVLLKELVRVHVVACGLGGGDE